MTLDIANFQALVILNLIESHVVANVTQGELVNIILKNERGLYAIILRF